MMTQALSKIATILASLTNTEKDTVHSTTRNSKGALILNVYKDKLSQTLTIGHTLISTLKEKLTPAEFKTIYHRKTRNP